MRVLDHGSIELLEHMGSDLSVVRNARQSYNAEWRTGEDAGKDAKLIQYLMRNRHTSPFECVTFTFSVKCPLFIARQWHRHRTQSYNEVSARYTQLPEEYYVPDPLLIGRQSKDNKQMRDVAAQRADAVIIADKINEHSARAYKLYGQLLQQHDCPRELARSVLPLNFYTRFSTTMNLHNLFHFIRLRIHEHAQYEIQVYAHAMLDLIAPIVPVSVEAFKETL